MKKITMKYEIIKQLCEIQKLTIPQLAQKIGLTKRGLYSSIENSSMKVETLEKIAEVLNVSISVFFQEGNLLEETSRLNEKNTQMKEQLVDLNKELEKLKKDLESKNELILTQEKIISNYRRLTHIHEITIEQYSKGIQEGNPETINFLKLLGAATTWSDDNQPDQE